MGCPGGERVTAIVVKSAKRNRLYVRSFDYDEARRRYEGGETIAELAHVYGVDPNAVRRAVVAGEADRQVEMHRRWRTGTCETCGGPAMRNVAGKVEQNPDGRVLCLRCRADEKRERLRFDDAGELTAVRCAMVDCANGERWQSPRSFTRGSRHREVRDGGIHSQCRKCQTRAKRRWRARAAA